MHIAKMSRIPALALALLIGLVVGGATLMVLMNRPAEYSARMGMLAAPNEGPWASETSLDFSAVASHSMPAIIEAAHSPSVLSAASATVPGGPSADELFDAVSVELVPGSTLARVTVQASSAEDAAQLARAVTRGIIEQNLFAPVGRLRVIDAEPFVTKVKPDETLATGLALAAGAAAAAAAMGLLALLRPSIQQRIEYALAHGGVKGSVPVIDTANGVERISRIETLCTASGRSIRVISLTPWAARDAEKLSLELADVGVRVAEDQFDQSAAVVGVAGRRDVDESIGSTVSALPEKAQLIAVVLQ